MLLSVCVPGFPKLQFQVENLDCPWDTMGSTMICVIGLSSAFSHTGCQVLRYTVADEVSTISNTQATSVGQSNLVFTWLQVENFSTPW